MERKSFIPRESKFNKGFQKKRKPFGETKNFKRREQSNFNKFTKQNIKRIENDKICVVAAFHSPTFSGRVGAELLRSCKEAGLKISASDRNTYLTQNGFTFGEDIESILNMPEYEENKIWVAPINDIPEKLYGNKNYIVTTFNAANPENKQLLKLKQAKRVWVPSDKHVNACIKAGINKLNLRVFDIPVAVSFNKMAVRPAELAKKKDVFRFLVCGSPTYVNGIEDVLKAYITEFKPKEKVELVIKLTHFPNLKKNLSFEVSELKKRIGALNDMFARVVVVSHTLRDEEFAGLIVSADAYVTAEKVSNSALGIKEAMLCNTALIAPKWLLDQTKINGDGVYSVEYEDEIAEAGKLFTNSAKQKVRKINCEKLAVVMRKAYSERKKYLVSGNPNCSKLAAEIKEAIKSR